MSVLGRKLVRELRRVRATLVAILLVVVVGVSCFVGLTTVYLNLESSRRAYYGQCRMADFWVSLKKAPLSDVERLTEVPGVADLALEQRALASKGGLFEDIYGLKVRLEEA